MARKLAPYGLFPLSILKNRDLTASERLVFLVICGHFNYELGKAWPSIATLSEETGISGNWIRQTCVPRLEKLGLIQVERKTGFGNLYFVPSIYADETPAPVIQLPTPGNSVTDYPVIQLPTPGNSVTPNKLIEQANNNKLIEQYISAPKTQPAAIQPAEPPKPKRKQKPKTPPEIVAEYEELYQLYPYSEHNDKGRGLKNYEKLRAGGVSFEELKTCVINYATARQGEDPKYTKGVGNFFSERLGGFWQGYREAKKTEVVPRSYRDFSKPQKSGAEELYDDLKNSGLIWEGDD